MTNEQFDRTWAWIGVCYDLLTNGVDVGWSGTENVFEFDGELGVHASIISQVVNRRIWKHV